MHLERKGVDVAQAMRCSDSIWSEVSSLAYRLIWCLSLRIFVRHGSASPEVEDGARRKKKLRISHFFGLVILLLAMGGKQIALDWLTERVGQDAGEFLRRWDNVIGEAPDVDHSSEQVNCLNNVLASAGV